METCMAALRAVLGEACMQGAGAATWRELPMRAR